MTGLEMSIIDFCNANAGATSAQIVAKFSGWTRRRKTVVGDLRYMCAAGWLSESADGRLHVTPLGVYARRYPQEV